MIVVIDVCLNMKGVIKMKCPSCGRYNIKNYGDSVHWQCNDCHWIFIKKKSKKKVVVKKVFFDEKLIWR